VRAQLAWLSKAVSARPFLFGDAPSAADLACWQTIFLLRKNCPPEVDALLGIKPNSPLVAWYDRIVALGQGTPTEMSSQEAFDVAAAATPAAVTHLDPNGDPGGMKAGTAVVVTPDDNARVPVRGQLVAASGDEVIIALQDNKAGALHVHFPRLGFEVVAG
jgi:glutathione S-transferase